MILSLSAVLFFMVTFWSVASPAQTPVAHWTLQIDQRGVGPAASSVVPTCSILSVFFAALLDVSHVSTGTKHHFPVAFDAVAVTKLSRRP